MEICLSRGNYFRGKFYADRTIFHGWWGWGRVANFHEGNYLWVQLSGEQLCREQFSWGKTVREAINRGATIQEAIISGAGGGGGGNYLEDEFLLVQLCNCATTVILCHFKVTQKLKNIVIFSVGIKKLK